MGWRTKEMAERKTEEDEWSRSTGRFHELDDENPWDSEEEEILGVPDDAPQTQDAGSAQDSADDTADADSECGEPEFRESTGLVYMDPKTLLSDIRVYYDTGMFSKRLADSMLTIAKRMANRGNFCNYSWRDEMVLDGYEKMALAIYNKKFDITKNYSPFSYLSRICWRCFVLKIKQEKRRKDAEKTFREQQYDRIRAENSGISFMEETMDGEKIYIPEEGRITEEFETDEEDE